MPATDTQFIAPAGAPVMQLARVDERAIQIHVPYDAGSLARLQAEAEADAKALVGLACPDDATYTALDGILTDTLRRLDAVEAAEKAITQPINAGLKAARDLFRPLRSSLDACVGMLKAPMGAWMQEKALAERQARAVALEAVKVGDHATMAQALTVAADVSGRPDAGAAARFAWEVERVLNPDLVPDEYWVLDTKQIDAVARAWSGKREDPPVVPGVKFKRVARIAGKH